ncbi:hypothetical protein ACOMHN_036609 [Nucella lapillus]
MDGDKVERLRERLLQCSVCMDEFTDPRLLPCHHTLCGPCINNLTQASISPRLFRCPQCRRDVCLPRGGVADLPVNFFVRSLQDELGEGVEEGGGPCGICQRSSLAAQFRCLDCDVDVCRFCIHSHRLGRHRDAPCVHILRMEGGEGASPPSSLATHKTCSVHSQEPVQLYCETCQRPVCVSCSCGEHRRHRVLPLGQKLHTARQDLQARLESLTRERREVRAWMRRLEGAQVEARDNADRTVAAVQRRTRELHGLVDRMSRAVVERVRREERQQVEELGGCGGEGRQLLQRLDLGVEVLRGLQEGDVCLELLDALDLFSQDLHQARQAVRAHAAVQICDHSFLAGRHLHLRGYLAATFGSLRARYSFLRFGSGSPPLVWRVWKRVSMFGGFVAVVLSAMLYTLVVLSAACYRGPQVENVAALVLTAYLTLAVCFAFSKA